MKLYSTIPTENGLLTSLQTLKIENNDLIGSIPTELFQLTNLHYFNLGRNQLTGTIPTEISQLSNLEKFIINGNRGITGQIPTTISQLSWLRKTFLDGTSLSSDANMICSLPHFRADMNADDDIGLAYADCGDVDGNYREVHCDCCRCCADVDNDGMGCSMMLIK
jgi:hypothetical protein